ncbi:MAG: hypothetical protein ACI841_003063 [Planctomycetota bacterium]|jgi:hypothetical protein
MQHRISRLYLLAMPAFALGSALGWSPQDKWTQRELERVTRVIERHVEELRGHSFKRPTEVRVADRKGFLSYVLQRDAEHRSKQQQITDQDLARHLGLIPADMDLMETTLELLEQQVGGFYDPSGDTFYLMETFGGGVAKVILAHELTHALDDQLFDLDAPFRQRKGNSDALLAYSCVVEGSGTNVMNRWTLGHRDEVSNEDLIAASSMGADSLAKAPPYLWKPLMAAYLKGEAFLMVGYKQLKKERKRDEPRPSINQAIDAAFAAPPLSMEQILHPEKYWSESERDDPSTVHHSLEDFPAGWKLRSRDVLGELSLALFTQPVHKRKGLDMSNPMALLTMKYTSAAVEGWDGDEVVLLENGNARVLHLATTWDTSADAKEFRDALRAIKPALMTSQETLVGKGSQTGWIMPESKDDRWCSLVVWAGCERAAIETLLEGPLRWQVEHK